MSPARNRRSLLVFSALAVDRWDEVMALGADAVCFDLEDGTAGTEKDRARTLCLERFEARCTTTSPVLRLLRINSPRTVDGIRDLAALSSMSHPPDGIVVPKVSAPEDIVQVSDVMSDAGHDVELIALIETQAGVGAARGIAVASPLVSALFLGSVDLSGELGSDMDWDALIRARGALVEAASEAGIDCIDGPWLSRDDPRGLEEEVRRVAAMGFTGKAGYDAEQIPVIHAAFTPSPEAVDFARRVVEAVAASPTGTARVDGQSVNKANAKGARRLLDLARRRGVG